MHLWTKRLLYSTPLLLGVGGWVLVDSWFSSYPPRAKGALRRALLAHDFGLGNPTQAIALYSRAYAETVAELPSHSHEAIGVLEKLADLYLELGMSDRHVDTLHLIFSSLQSDPADSSRRVRSLLRTAQLLADAAHGAKNMRDEAFYHKFILQTSLAQGGDETGKMSLLRHADPVQVAASLEVMARLYAERNMPSVAIQGTRLSANHSVRQCPHGD